MKSLIVSDLHGSFNPSWIKDAKEAGIERLVCLGDYDKPNLLKEILKIKMKKIILIGNHDYHLCRGINLTSPELDNDVDYYDLWEDTPEAGFINEASRKQIRKNGLRAGIKICEVINGKRVVYVHGGLCSSFFKERNIPEELWTRLLHPPYESDILPNFLRMTKEKIDVMFRGHDHKQAVLSWSKKDLFPMCMENSHLYEGIKFERGKKYIVSLGKLDNVSYAIYDSFRQSVKFGHMD